MIRDKKQHGGFTLIEVMAASVITAFIAMVAVSGLMGVTSARQQVDEVTVINDELRFVADQIRQDLAGFYRNQEDMLFEGLLEDTPEGLFPIMRFRTVCDAKARLDHPEGDLYEVEYFLAAGEEGQPWIARRKCPIVGNEETILETAGGVLTRLAEQLSLFGLRYFNGSEWLTEWPMELNRTPMLIEVSLGAVLENEDGIQTVHTKQFFVNFPRHEQSSGTEEPVDLEMNVESAEEALGQ
jgi:prepilin-type N-terminal cleavage/methylation domain-containing protein